MAEGGRLCDLKTRELIALATVKLVIKESTSLRTESIAQNLSSHYAQVADKCRIRPTSVATILGWKRRALEVQRVHGVVHRLIGGKSL